MEKPDLEDLKQFVKEYTFPTDVLVEVVAKCNLNCIMCPQSRLTRPVGKISFDLWKKIVDEIAQKSPKTRLWPALMGEPLLHNKEVFEMIAYAKSQGVEVHLNTNLALFKKEMLNSLMDCGVHEILIGLDGATAETYEKIRRGAKFDRVLKNIHLILNEKVTRKIDIPLVTLQFIVMNENAHEEKSFIDYWKKSGETVSLKIKPRLGWSDGVEPWERIKNVKKEDRDLPCTYLLRQMTIFWNGHVPQCDGDWDGQTNFGNVNHQSLEEIWLEGLKKIRDRHMLLDFNFPPCNKCEDWQGGRANWIECGVDK